MIRSCPILATCLALATSCAEPDAELDEVDVSDLMPLGGGGQSVVYVGKTTTTDFTGLGQHLQYWPLFGMDSPTAGRRTDDPNCIELTPSFASFKHHFLLDGRTFSNDALGVPIGTKTKGGYSNWPMFTLPDGTTGRSGTFYDESNIDNSNNTVNQMRINVGDLNAFCLNLITDNTDGEHNADVRFEARSDTVDLDLAGHPDHTFDGQTDMYTFRYTGMQEDDVFKVRIQCSSASGCAGAGLGGIMVSDIDTCTDDTSTPDAGPGIDPPEVDAGGGSGNNSEDDAAGCRVSGQGGGAGLALLILAIAHLRRRRVGLPDSDTRPTSPR